ncbi:MAG: DUF11 domain-containing protein, partial [Anaerolineales bacterium]|nr:DUF11 domain-containing protein [Anaerolineales bacterium]
MRSPRTAVLGLVVVFFLILSPLFGVAEAAGAGVEAADTRVDAAARAAERQPLPSEESAARLVAAEPTPTPTRLAERGAAWLPAWTAPLFDESLEVAIAGLTFVQSATSTMDDPGGVYNGDRLTYTIALENGTAAELGDLVVVDLLPEDALDRMVCDPACTWVNEENTIPEPSGGTVVLTVTRAVSWTLPTLAAGQRVTLTVSGRVIGQGEGMVLTNYVYAVALRDPGPIYADGNDSLSLVAHIRVETDGGAGVSDVPTWFSEDIGGTISQDWGDFDRDGDLDLTLGSSLGTSIYRNDNGELVRIWDSATGAGEDYRLSYGVRWADLDQDSQQDLELAAVGESVDGSAVSPGINYVYKYSRAVQSFVQTSVFTSQYQLVRLAPADYDGDGDVDLVASTNAIVAGS